MNIGIGAAAVSVGAVSGVGLGLFKILFLNDLLALDHAASAVGTVVPALFAAGAAAGAEFVVLDFGSGDLFAVFRAAGVSTEADAVGDPVNKSDNGKDRHHKENNHRDQSANDGK